jgi:hypothetical protein
MNLGAFGELQSEGLPGLFDPVAPAVVDVGAREAKLQLLFALPRTIPDDPDYRKYVPIEYRLNAKAISVAFADDLRQSEPDFWVELAHWGVVASEIFTEVAALGLATPVLAFVGLGLALGAGYAGAADKIAAEWASRGFSRGAVMGAERRADGTAIRARPDDYFGRQYPPDYRNFEHGNTVAANFYKVGMGAGLAQGRVLSQNQRVIFWRDLGRRMGDQGSTANWRLEQWQDLHRRLAETFWRDHLVSDA